MSFCPQCNCQACQKTRSSKDPVARASADALRLVLTAGPTGMTRSEMTKFSRPFKAVALSVQEAVLNEMVKEGLMKVYKFAPLSGRGKSRVAFVAAQVSQ